MLGTSQSAFFLTPSLHKPVDEQNKKTDQIIGHDTPIDTRPVSLRSKTAYGNESELTAVRAKEPKASNTVRAAEGISLQHSHSI